MKYSKFKELCMMCERNGFTTMGDIVFFLKKHNLNIFEFFEILKKREVK